MKRVWKLMRGADGIDPPAGGPDPFLHWLPCKKNINAAFAAFNVF